MDSIPASGGPTLVDLLSNSDLERLAELLRPHLSEEAPQASSEWLRGAEAIAGYIGSPVSRVYALVSCRRIPVEREGRWLVARRSELDKWIEAGGGRRP